MGYLDCERFKGKRAAPPAKRRRGPDDETVT